MKIVIVSATENECFLIKKKLDEIDIPNLKVDFFVSGVSIPFFMFNFMEYLQKNDKADLYINTGICGSFNANVAGLGDVVEVVSDCFADLEITHDTKSQSIFSTDFVDADTFPFEKGIIKNTSLTPYKYVRQVKAITVNSTSGRDKQIKERIEKFSPDIESMEGAVFAYICELKSLKYRQIRSVSNIIKRRSLQEWNINLALEHLATEIINLLIEISKQITK